MNDETNQLVETCLETNQFQTIKIENHFILLHENLNGNGSLRPDIPRSIMRTLFPSNGICANDAKIVEHVHASLYQLIIFADRSVVYTRRKFPRASKRLPYYVEDDLNLLRAIGISDDEIDIFVKKLDSPNEPILDDANIIQRIVFYMDFPTRLKCRCLNRKWKNSIDQSSVWRRVELNEISRHIEKACRYFQLVHVEHLDLSRCSLSISKQFPFQSNCRIDSLRSLQLSSDHPLELFRFLLQIAPCIEDVQLTQSREFNTKSKRNTQLYDSIHFLIDQCQKHLKNLRRLNVQVRSFSDQKFLQQLSPTQLPISYEVI